MNARIVYGIAVARGCRWRLAPLLALTLVAVAMPALAANLAWDGGVGGAWQDGATGWLDGTNPAAWSSATPDAASFTGAAPTSLSIDAGGVTAGNITVTAGEYTFGGAGTLTLAGSTFDIASSLTATAAAALGGSTGLTKAGGGTLVLSGANKGYAGPTIISGGAIQIAAASAGNLGASATGAVTLNGGALHGNFPTNTPVGQVFTIGAAGGELRNLGGEGGRWLVGGNDKFQGSGTLTIAFGSSNTRLQLQSTAHPNFTGKWIVDSGGNANRFLDLAQASVNFGAATGDDALTLRNTGTILLRGDTLGSATQGLTVGTGGGKVNIAGGMAATIAARISGDAGNPLEFYLENGNSVLTLANVNNSWLGSTTLNGGAAGALVRLGAAGVLPDAGGTITISGSTTLDLNSFSETIGGLSGTGTVTNSAGSATLSVGGGGESSTFAGRFAEGGGTLALTKVGSGTFALSGGGKSYTGPTTVNGGAIAITSAGAGNLGAAATGAVNLDGGALHGTFAGNTTTSYQISAGGAGGELRNLGLGWWLPAADTISGSGVLTLSFGTNSTRFVMLANRSQIGFTGKWVVDSGSNANRILDLYQAGVNLGSAAGDDALTLRNAGSILLRGDTLGGPTQGVTIGSGGGKITVAGDASAIIAGRISGAATNLLEFYLENGLSVLTLTHTNNSWLATTSVNAGAAGGTLRLGASGVLPDAGGNLVLSSLAVLDLLGHTETIGGLAGSGRVRSVMGDATLRLGSNNNSPTFTGVVEDGGGVVSVAKVGTGHQTFAGTNTYSGTTTIWSGTLQWNHACLPTNDVYVSSGATLVLNFTGTNTIRKLFLDGEGLATGVYRSANAPAGMTITGPGALLVTQSDRPAALVILVR